MRSQGFGCSPIKKSRELGLDRTGSNTKVFELVLVPSNPSLSIRTIEIKKRTNQPRRRYIAMCNDKLANIGRTRRYIPGQFRGKEHLVRVLPVETER